MYSLRVLFVVSVIAVAVSVTCPADGLWPVSEGGIDIEINCRKGTYGRMSRYCMMTINGTAEWQEVKDSYCLDLTPAPGMAYIDMIYNISGSRYRFMQYSPSGFKNALDFLYRINKTSVTVHRITEEANMHSSAQVRITLPKKSAMSLYEKIMSSDRADEMAAYFQQHNNNGRRYQYLTLKGNLHCDVLYIGERKLTFTDYSPIYQFDAYMAEHMLWIIICVVELIVLAIVLINKYLKKRVEEVNQGLV